MVLGYLNQSWNRYTSFGIDRDIHSPTIQLVSINPINGKVVVFCDFNSLELLIDIIFGVEPEEKIVIEETF
jgi:flagellar motor switch protein FliM